MSDGRLPRLRQTARTRSNGPCLLAALVSLLIAARHPLGTATVVFALFSAAFLWSARCRRSTGERPNPQGARLGRYQFTMRGLLVAVAVLGVWLGWQLRFVHDRAIVLKQAADQGVVVTRVNPCNPQPEIPAIRRLLGDQPVAFLDWPPGNVGDDQIQQLANLFPEARIYGDDGSQRTPSWTRWF